MSNKGGLSENYYNTALASLINGLTEVSYSFIYNTIGNRDYSGSIRIDIVTDKYVIEGGKDKRSSLDSIQQAAFASKYPENFLQSQFLILTMVGAYLNTELKKHVMNLIISLFVF